MSPLWSSQFDIPYSPTSPLHTFDLHIRTCSSSTNPNPPPTSSSRQFLLIFIHGGAFRDPDETSRGILPSLPTLFALPIHAVASVNYRLAAHPNHPTNPSDPADPSRNAVWPAPVDDVVRAIEYLASDPGRALWKGDESSADEAVGTNVILAGHSAGGTLCLHAAARVSGAARVRAVVGVAGVYDFTALRDAHPAARAMYESINTGLLGSEMEGGADGDDDGWKGGWERGKVRGEEWRAEGVEVVVLGHGRADKLVDMNQAEDLATEFAGEGGGTRPVVKLVECEGSHDEMVTGGEEIGRCVRVAVETLLGRSSSGLA